MPKLEKVADNLRGSLTMSFRYECGDERATKQSGRVSPVGVVKGGPVIDLVVKDDVFLQQSSKSLSHVPQAYVRVFASEFEDGVAAFLR